MKNPKLQDTALTFKMQFQFLFKGVKTLGVNWTQWGVLPYNKIVVQTWSACSLLEVISFHSLVLFGLLGSK